LSLLTVAGVKRVKVNSWIALPDQIGGRGYFRTRWNRFHDQMLTSELTYWVHLLKARNYLIFTEDVYRLPFLDVCLEKDNEGMFAISLL